MEDAFCGFIVHSEENEQKLKEIRLDSVKKLFTSLSEVGTSICRLEIVQSFRIYLHHTINSILYQNAMIDCLIMLQRK